MKLRLPEITRHVQAAGYLLVGAAVGLVTMGNATHWPERLDALEAAQAQYVADSIPQRVRRLERDHRGLDYLVCRAVREDAGQDPKDCREKLRGITDYLDEIGQ